MVGKRATCAPLSNSFRERGNSPFDLVEGERFGVCTIVGRFDSSTPASLTPDAQSYTKFSWFYFSKLFSPYTGEALFRIVVFRLVEQPLAWCCLFSEVHDTNWPRQNH